jgi:hypothetical protein
MAKPVESIKSIKFVLIVGADFLPDGGTQAFAPQFLGEKTPKDARNTRQTDIS